MLLLLCHPPVWHAEQGPLSGQLTQACVAKFESSKDALFLVPAIPGMQRAQVLQVTSLHPTQLQHSSLLGSSGLQADEARKYGPFAVCGYLAAFCCFKAVCTPKQRSLLLL